MKGSKGKRMTKWAIASCLALAVSGMLSAQAQEILPFPPKPSGSTAGKTMQDSIYSPLPSVRHLPKDVPEIRPGILAGYLQPDALPDSLALLPPPPAAGSAAFALDEEVSRKSLTLRGTPRWKLAAEDADLMFPQAAGAFSCALGAPITEQDAPHLYMLLRRTLADAGLSTYKAKDHYSRTRPFVLNNEPTCTPDEEEHLKKDGSYPSGHTALGWAWALILTEIAPDRAEAEALAQPSQTLDGEAKILQSWQGDDPVAHLDLLPEKQRQQAVGFIGDAGTFKSVWKAFKPGEAVPEINFAANLALLARNTQFYNSIRIGKVKVLNGAAEVLVMETMSAMPIKDKVAISLVLVTRQGITAIQSADQIISVNKK